jgi:release factor glutamine methyltransferase
MIVSNPPYVTEIEKLTLHPNVLNYEPAAALFVKDNEPLIFYQSILNFANHHLIKEGAIYFEVNQDYAQNVSELLQQAGYITEVKKDLSGNERMIRAKKS